MTVSVAVPVISPVVGLSANVAGKSGAISYVPPLTDLYGASVEIAVLLRATKVGGTFTPFGSLSGPATQIGGTAFGPSQIPSPSVSGFNGSVPVFVASM